MNHTEPIRLRCWMLMLWGMAMPLLAVDESFWTKLDLARPELAAVKAAHDQGDSAGAAAALLAYFRARQTPKWYTASPPAPVEKPEATDASAEKILRREYSFVGKSATLTHDLDWNANPLKDAEWPIELNRHYTWVRLVDAYNATGNPAYAEDFLAQLQDWCADNPRPTSSRQGRFTWRTLECGIRLSGSWPRCFFGILNSPQFTPELLCLMLNAMGEQADYLTKFHGGGNWLVTETSGLMTCAVLFPEFADAPRWRQICFDRLAKEIDNQVPPDGAQVELTPHYHGVTLDSFANATRIAEFNGVPVPENVQAGVLRMARYLLDVSKPDLHIPMFNDSDDGSVLGRLKPFATPEYPDFQYVVSRGKEGTAPAYTSVALPYAGQYVMRSGWDELALYLAMDAGPYGAGHQHEDKLQISLHAFGRSLLLDPGRFTYAGGPWRSYFVGTQSHNTMLVDGHGQSRSRTPHQRWIGRSAQDNLWLTNEVFDFMTGSYAEGYGGSDDGLVHIRKVFFRRGEYWLVHDLLVGPADPVETHVAEIQYQFGMTGITAEEDGAVVLSHNPDTNLALLPVSAQPYSVQLHEGEEKPPKGWVAWSLHKALKTAATMVVVRQEAALPIRVDTLLLPYAGTERPDVHIRRLPEDAPGLSALEITGPGWRDVYHCSHGPAGGSRIDWVRYDEKGHELASAVHGWVPDQAAPALAHVPARTGVNVTVPAAGRLVLDYGYAAGGGYLFHREQDAQAGENRLPVPSMLPGQSYVYAIQFVGEDGKTGQCHGVYVPVEPALADFQDGEMGDWSHAEIAVEEGNKFLRAKGEATTGAVYMGINHPLHGQFGEAPMVLRYRMPFADGGDWCYGKISLTDSQKRRWSAYVADKPAATWQKVTVQRTSFRRDDGKEGAGATLPEDAVLTALSFTIRKGKTKTAVVPILDLDDVALGDGR